MLEPVLLFFVGLALGSFINVLAWRYEPGQHIFSLGSLAGRSHCPACRKELKWHELIPLLSFVLQGGRCRTCGSRISLVYPIVELVSGLALVLVPTTLSRVYQVNLHRVSGSEPEWYYFLAFIFALAALTLILISVIDFRWRIIPDQSTLLIALLGIAAIFIVNHYGLFNEIGGGSFLEFHAAIFGIRNSVLLNHLVAALIGLGFLGLIVIVSRGRGMGLGDVKLAGALGLLLGWPDIAVGLILAFITGAFSSIILIVTGKKRLKSTVPFGPFIALGALLVIFFGTEIMEAYFAFFP